MDAVNQFFHMGGYATFIWPAYAVAAIVLAGLAAWSVVGARRQKRLLDSLPRRRDSRPDEGPDSDA
jgi:heme exporter protein D